MYARGTEGGRGREREREGEGRGKEDSKKGEESGKREEGGREVITICSKFVQYCMTYSTWSYKAL